MLKTSFGQLYRRFSQYLDFFFFFAPSDSRFSNSCISSKYCPIITNHTSKLIYSAFLCVFLYSRILSGVAGQLRKVSERHVCAHIWQTVHAQLGDVRGSVLRAQALLHRWKRQPGGSAERLLVQTPGAHVSAAQLSVHLHRRLSGVHQQIHRPVKALRRRATQAQGSGHQGLHRGSLVRSRTHGGSGSGQQSGKGKTSIFTQVFLLVLSFHWTSRQVSGLQRLSMK